MMFKYLHKNFIHTLGMIEILRWGQWCLYWKCIPSHPAYPFWEESGSGQYSWDVLKDALQIVCVWMYIIGLHHMWLLMQPDILICLAYCWKMDAPISPQSVQIRYRSTGPVYVHTHTVVSCLPPSSGLASKLSCFSLRVFINRCTCVWIEPICRLTNRNLRPSLTAGL